jgi:hypothetical protein
MSDEEIAGSGLSTPESGIDGHQRWYNEPRNRRQEHPEEEATVA